ncbi:DUF6894 family protein [Aureimonas glaciei]|uniref:DUF6894 domain-containing protein n=1 Tax=Aureimonas glaciei TaxID=1776957 RepID=A0A916Y3A3_9HYPH|nr:hypothetical protein [Aureimonas glaciei]GGD29114.1 hypothetical protein GCM10011335_35320 [Aureimonas glaciei]
MAIYFFNLRNGNSLLTASEGQEFESTADAQQGAEEYAREIFAELVRAGKQVNGQVIDILDPLGTTVGMVRLIDQPHLQPDAPLKDG